MYNYPSTKKVGDITITLFNAGDLQFDMASEFDIPRSEWRPSDRAIFEQPAQVPVQCALVQTPETTVLVDAGAYDVGSEPGLAVPGYAPPPALPQQLAAAGVPAARIEHVVITHAHFDHFNGLTVRDSVGGWQRVYGNAMVHLGSADWDQDEIQARLSSAASLESRTLGLLHERGVLALTSERRQIAPGVEILPTPGETPGHIALRVESAGQVAYCLGDLYHHTVEVEMPQWSVAWADRGALSASRSSVAASALVEDALLTATHIAGFGRLVRRGDGVRWEPA